jgi:hypothetical protein
MESLTMPKAEEYFVIDGPSVVIHFVGNDHDNVSKMEYTFSDGSRYAKLDYLRLLLDLEVDIPQELDTCCSCGACGSCLCGLALLPILPFSLFAGLLVDVVTCCSCPLTPPKKEAPEDPFYPREKEKCTCCPFTHYVDHALAAFTYSEDQKMYEIFMKTLREICYQMNLRGGFMACLKQNLLYLSDLVLRGGSALALIKLEERKAGKISPYYYPKRPVINTTMPDKLVIDDNNWIEKVEETLVDMDKNRLKDWLTENDLHVLAKLLWEKGFDGRTAAEVTDADLKEEFPSVSFADRKKFLGLVNEEKRKLSTVSSTTVLTMTQQNTPISPMHIERDKGKDDKSFVQGAKKAAGEEITNRLINCLI